MSLTGLFLITFLIVHLAGNLQLLKNDGGEAFNIYAYFMTHNPLIKFLSYGLYFFIVLHAIQGIIIAVKNRRAKGSNYAVNTTENASFASKNMALLGVLILAFLFMHMGDFWLKMKMGQLSMAEYQGLDYQVSNLFERVDVAFNVLWIVIVYVIGQIALAFHLWHGFSSAFQTLGLNHKKYNPAIAFLGKVYSILIPLGFAIIPIVMYLK
jgi:succinate dehydrogenase / fumarate reductase cytochrome b subunit